MSKFIWRKTLPVDIIAELLRSISAHVAELVDAHGSGPCAARCGGSSPSVGTTEFRKKPPSGGFFVFQWRHRAADHFRPAWRTRSTRPKINIRVSTLKQGGNVRDFHFRQLISCPSNHCHGKSYLDQSVIGQKPTFKIFKVWAHGCARVY